jgi:hypothetical protein
MQNGSIRRKRQEEAGEGGRVYERIDEGALQVKGECRGWDAEAISKARAWEVAKMVDWEREDRSGESWQR